MKILTFYGMKLCDEGDCIKSETVLRNETFMRRETVCRARLCEELSCMRRQTVWGGDCNSRKLCDERLTVFVGSLYEESDCVKSETLI